MKPATSSTLGFELVELLARRFPAASTEALLAATLCAQRADEGHVCLDLREFADGIWQGQATPALADWRAALAASPFVGHPGQARPLLLDGDRLYLGQLWADERQIAAELAARAGPSRFDSAAVERVLRPWFAKNAGDEGQRRAAATALSQRIGLIAGGPGTGKTTTVAKLLAALATLWPEARVQLAAPTGKAAARLVEALDGAKAKLGLDLVTQAMLPASATTLHRLLGYRPDSSQPRHSRDNPLALDLLIVDEASMIDQALFSRLLLALPGHAQLILLGDPDQLASVEAGNCFAELAGMTAAKTSLSGAAARVASGISTLNISHRFGGVLGELARGCLAGDLTSVASQLRAGGAEASWLASLQADWASALLARLDLALADYRLGVLAGDVDAAWAAFNRLRIVCALRDGPAGVAAINRAIETRLWREAQRQDARHAPWYAGRPVIVRSNAPALGLSNGDIGLTLSGHDGLRVHFPASGGWRSLPPSRLPAHETAFAMTVHQSQGSEFDEVWLILPDSDSPVLNRNLVYTALTRARSRVALWGPAGSLAAALGRDEQRRSGLAWRLGLLG
jgi:exodeoxyribonuclease V alpha subunit